MSLKMAIAANAHAMRIRMLNLFVLLPLSIACLAQEATFRMDTVNDTLHLLRIGDGEGWRLPFPVYRLETGDVDGDGSADAIVGVVKTTRHDPVVRRRVFVFKNYHGLVRPLWLGSRMGQPIQDFHFIKASRRIRVLEAECDGSSLVAEYRWRAFGMEFVRYLKRGCSEEEARNLMNNEYE